MKTLTYTLPIKHRGQALQIGYDGRNAFFNYGGRPLYFIVSKPLLYGVGAISLVLLTLLLSGYGTTRIEQMIVQIDGQDYEQFSQLQQEGKLPIDTRKVGYVARVEARQGAAQQGAAQQNVRANPAETQYGPAPAAQPTVPTGAIETELRPTEGAADPIDEMLQSFDDYEEVALHEDFKEQFIVKKQLLITKYLINNRVSRLDQLSNARLLELNRAIGQLFHELILGNIPVEPHVLTYFTDTTDLDKLATALMEQAKYNVPASIKLAQSAMETAYGRRVMHNNYFGIKDKSGSAPLTTTVEYYSPEEYRKNHGHVTRYEILNVKGKTLYKCQVTDHFVQYETPWKSFRAHSVFLSNNPRYSPLFTKGKNYAEWADKIGSTKYGGVGYATSPVYGQILKRIIRRYHLDLLDY